MLGLVPSASLLGVDGHAVTVEVHFSGGLPSFTVVGLPDASCREARDRVRAALLSSGQRLARPAGHRQPGAAHRAQGRLRARPRDRGGPARRRRRRHPGGRRRPGLPRRAGARRHASARCRARSASPRRSARRGRSCCAAPSAVEGRIVGRPRRAPGASRSARSSPACEGDASRGRTAPPVPPAAPRRPGPDLARRPRAAGGPLRAGGRRRRRSPPAPARPAGGGQDDAGRAAARACSRRSATARRCETTRIHSAAGARRCPPSGLVAHPAVPGAAPRRVGRRARRRRHRRCCARARSARPPTACCSSTSWPSSPPGCSTRCASRSRRAWSASPGPAASATIPARFLLVAAMNPCPCGGGTRPGRMPVQRGRPAALPAAGVGAAARPVRPAGRGAAPRGRRPVRSGTRRALRGRGRARPRRPRRWPPAAGCRSNADAAPPAHLDAVAPLQRRRHPAARGRPAERSAVGPRPAPHPPGRPHDRRPGRRSRSDRGGPRGRRAGAAGRSCRRPRRDRDGRGVTGDRATGCAALLAGLPNMTPRRLRALLADEEPEAAWSRATSGRVGDLVALRRPGAPKDELPGLAGIVAGPRWTPTPRRWAPATGSRACRCGWCGDAGLPRGAAVGPRATGRAPSCTDRSRCSTVRGSRSSAHGGAPGRVRRWPATSGRDLAGVRRGGGLRAGAGHRRRRPRRGAGRRRHGSSRRSA